MKTNLNVVLLLSTVTTLCCISRPSEAFFEESCVGPVFTSVMNTKTGICGKSFMESIRRSAKFDGQQISEVSRCCASNEIVECFGSEILKECGPGYDSSLTTLDKITMAVATGSLVWAVKTEFPRFHRENGGITEGCESKLYVPSSSICHGLKLMNSESVNKVEDNIITTTELL